ncbi:MAG: alkaline phosphatase family protein [Blastocatellia bacterium]
MRPITLPLMLQRMFCSLLVIAVSLSATPATTAVRRGSAKPPQKPTARRNATVAGKPRLVVGLVIDQFRYDYLTRFEDQFVESGFRRLLRDGAVFANAHYNYTPTVTACGHAAFMSGTSPAHNGIIGNEWFDRATGKRITSVIDDKTKLLGGKTGAGMSPHRLQGSTLGDQLKLASGGQAKVIGVALKDRAAILPAGKHANGAYWYDASNGAFVSSTYYFSDLPEWVKKFNREQSVDRFYGKTWDRLLPESAYARSLPDNYPHEKWTVGTEKWVVGTKFPYTINGGEPKPGTRFYTQLESTPFANDQTIAFAKAAIEAEELGRDDATDLLTISLSANDILGHSFGPYSQEVHDITLRTDRQFAELFTWLDQKIGLQHIVFALTADHGVGPIPEHAMEYGMGGRIEAAAISKAAEAALSQRFGAAKYVLNFVNGNMYFDYAALEKQKATREEAERIAAAAISEIDGIAACFTRTRIINGALPQTAVARSVAEGFYPDRNGDLVVVSKPFYLAGESIVASHGTPYSYDTHVPVIFYGAGVNPGVSLTLAGPVDIAPTLAALLKLNPPSNATGQVLAEAVRVNQKP